MKNNSDLKSEDVIEEASLDSQPKIRLDYLDIAKAIAMILVVIGHVPDSFDAPHYRVVLYTFHMPLFFVISGMVSKRRKNFEDYNLKNFGKFFVKNIFAIVVPYMIWALIYMQFDIKKIPLILYGTRWSIDAAASITVLWFSPCIFSSRIITELLMWISTKFKMNVKLFACIAAVIMFVLGFVLPVTPLQFPFGLSQAPIAVSFMLIGYVLKDTVEKFHQKAITHHLLVLLISTILFYVGVYVIEGQELVSMFVCSYGNPIRFICNATSGYTIVLTLSSLITKLPGKFKNFLLWLGQNTMGIYLVHVPITRNLISPFLQDTFGLARMSLVGGLVSGIISLSISCILVVIIDKYIPQLFGKELSKAYC